MSTIEKLMEKARLEIEIRLGKDLFTDDWQWNETCFQFVVCKINGNPMNARVSDPYRFCYDDDEEIFGTAEEQVAEWIDFWF